MRCPSNLRTCSSSRAKASVSESCRRASCSAARWSFWPLSGNGIDLHRCEHMEIVDVPREDGFVARHQSNGHQLTCEIAFRFDNRDMVDLRGVEIRAQALQLAL